MLDPAIPPSRVHKVSIKGLNYIVAQTGDTVWQNTGLGIILEPMIKEPGTHFWWTSIMIGFYYTSGVQINRGKLVATTNYWYEGNQLTMVVDMDRNEFWWEVYGVIQGLIGRLNITEGQRRSLHFIMVSHTANAEVEIIDLPQ